MTPYFSFARRSTTRSRPQAWRHQLPLYLETLEDRCVPAGTLVGLPFTAQPVEGTAFTGQVATVFDTGPLAPALTITINWGDGAIVDTTSGIATAVVGSPGAFTISGTHTYAEESSSAPPSSATPVTVTVQDTANSISLITINSAASVLDAGLSPGNPISAAPSQTFLGGATGSATTTAAALASYEAAIGGVKNTAAAPQTGGFRTITWDGVKTDGSDSAAGINSTIVITPKTVGIPLNRFEGSGVFFGAVYAVSSDSFAAANPSVAGLFPPFSPNNTFAMFNDNGIDFDFVAPASTSSTIVSASTRGFGAVFTNVEQANTTSIEYFNGNTLLATVFAPVGGLGQSVFVGALFTNPIVTRVNLTLGTDVIFNFDGTTLKAGKADSRGAAGTNLVVTDDWAYPEPVPTPNGLPIVSGAQGSTSAALLPGSATATLAVSRVVGTFSDVDTNGNAKDFTATINWGDGHLTNGTIAKNASGGFDVSGSNTYATSGLFPINIDVADFGGSTLSVNNTLNVAAAPAVVVAPATLPTGTVGTAFGSPTFTASGGSGTGFTFTETGALPTGLTFNAATAQLTGTPTQAGTFSGIVITAKDNFGGTGSTTYTLTINSSGKPFNFDKLGAYRASDGSWSLDSDGTLGFNSATDQVFSKFSPTNVTGVVGDWTGTGRFNIGDFNNGVWHLDLNNDGKVEGNESFTFGQAGDKPVVGNWDGNANGISKLGVFRDSGDAAHSGLFIEDTNNDKVIDSGDATFKFGLATDNIIVGDWTHTGKTKVGVFRDAVSFLAADAGDIVFSLNTSDTDTTVFTNFVFGLITDKVVIGDWNGDGFAKVATYRDAASAPVGNPLHAPGVALFSLDSNGNHAFDPGVDSVFLFGLQSDQFVGGNWVVTPPLQPSSLLAAGGQGSGAAALTTAELTPAVNQAIDSWAAAGLDAASLTHLRSLNVSIAVLGAGELGEEVPGAITLDATAAGHGWSTTGEAGKRDLVTALDHEMGHALGLDHSSLESDVMFESLASGVRKAPTTQDVDALFSHL